MFVRLFLRSASQLSRKRLVGARALVQAAPAGGGKARTPVSDQTAEDGVIATRDQHVGYPLAQTLSVRQRQEMVLTLAPGNREEVALGESFRLNEHRTGHIRVVVQHKHLDDIDGCAADRGMSAEDVAQVLAKFNRLPRDSARRVLNFFRIRLEKGSGPAIPQDLRVQI